MLSSRALLALPRACGATALRAPPRFSAPRAAAARALVTGSYTPTSTAELAKRMPRSFAEYPNDVLLILAAEGKEEAIMERMTREIMRSDDVCWESAQPKVTELIAFAKTGLWIAKFPYRVGITAALVAGFGSIPMCFDIHTALWFNEGYVTSDVPEAKDLETWLEVGSWSWGWMEPPLGQASFFLLCIQYSRAQMTNIGMQPYTEMLHSNRASKLKKKYPQYDASVLCDFSRMTFRS
ncbi:hypothetical protein M885DRAFT_533137 [Pelagophyceae sp. CCMP2097]|nr:hypothetical protein M885DRAFT_533137 [Pelagophyceae sp. CCMP2097]